MSFQAMTWAYAQKTDDAESKLILLSLANYAGHDNTCFPSVPRLAKECYLAESTVRERLKRLQGLDLLNISKRETGPGTYTSNLYSLLVNNHINPRPTPPSDGPPPPPSGGGESVSNEPVESTMSNTEGSPSSEVPPTLRDVEELKSVVGVMFKRAPGKRWTQPEELLACEITRSPDWKKEWVELAAFREKTEFFPKSVHGLLDGWQKTLDRARNHPQNTLAQTTTAAKKTPGQVYALKTQIDAIEQRMAELKAHGTYEVSGGRVVWSDEAMKTEHRELRTKLDKLKGELIDT